MPTKRTNLEIHEVSLCKRGANQGSKVVLAKSTEIDMPGTVEELTKQVADLTAERDQFKAEVETLKKEKPEQEKPEDKLAKVDPEIRALIEKAQSDADAARAEAKAASESLEKSKRESLEKAVNERLEKMKDALGGETERTSILKIAVGLNDEQREVFMKTLEKANTLAANGGTNELSKEKGDSKSKDGLTAKDEIEKKATELVTKDKITIHKARTIVRDANPELAKREEAETKERK